MNNRSFLLLSLTAAVFAPALDARAQQAAPSPAFTRPRVVNASQQAAAQAAPAAPTQTPAPARPTQTPPAAGQQGTTPAPTATPAPYSTPGVPAAAPQYVPPAVPLQPAHPPSLSKFRERTAEAQRLLKSRLTLTSSTPNTAFVTLAALEDGSSKIHTLSLPKETFLKRGADVVLTTAQGLNVRLQVVRSNYVNTAVVVS
ncbi:MAG TPA: hypothetical protein VF570_10125, partial [Pyrinomonadaceae bacterium]